MHIFQNTGHLSINILIISFIPLHGCLNNHERLTLQERPNIYHMQCVLCTETLTNNKQESRLQQWRLYQVSANNLDCNNDYQASAKANYGKSVISRLLSL